MALRLLHTLVPVLVEKIEKVKVCNVFVLSLQYNDMIWTCDVRLSRMEPGATKRFKQRDHMISGDRLFFVNKKVSFAL